MLARGLAAGRVAIGRQTLLRKSFVALQSLPNAAPFSTRPRRAEGVSATTSSSSDEIVAVSERFVRLNKLFETPRHANSDEVIEDMRALIDLDIKVPLSYYMDSIRLFTSRRDMLRTELLLHMCRKNMKSVGPIEDPANVYRFNRSQSHNSAYQQVVSHAISHLIARGVTEEAMRLWVRMASLGYVTNRTSLYQIMSRMATSNERTTSLDLLDKLHGIMKKQSWHSSPMYHCLYLGVLRQHLRSCETLATVSAGMLRVDSAYKESTSEVREGEGAFGLATVLHATRLQCLLSAEESCRRRFGESEGGDAETLKAAAEQYGDLALKGFHELIKSRDCARDSALPIWEEISRMFDVEESKARMHQLAREQSGSDESPPKYSRLSANNAFSDSGAGAERGMPAMASFLADLPPMSYPLEGAGSYSEQFMGLGRGSTPAFAVRSVVHGLIVSLCRRGKTQDALEVLKVYLGHLSLQAAPPVSERAAEGGGGGAGGASGQAAIATAGKTPLLSALERMAGRPTPLNARHIPNVSAVKSPKFSYSDAAWSRFLIGEAAENIHFPALAAGASSAELDKNQSKRKNRYAATDDFVSKLQELASANGLQLGPLFYRRRVLHASECLEPTDWMAFERRAYLLIDSVEDSLGRTPHAYEALVSGLALNYSDPRAVHRAFRVVYEMIAAKIPVLPATWTALLHGAADKLEDGELQEMLAAAEDLIRAVPEADNNAMVLKARLCAHARLGNGYRCLEVLKSLRQHLPAYSTSDLNRHVYVQVINALYYTWPGAESEWFIANSPQKTAEYLMREMYRDGIALTPGVVAALLKLFTKQAQMAVGRRTRSKKFSESEATLMIDQAHNFARDASLGGFAGHVKAAVGSDSIRELVKMACVLRDEHKALEILRSAKEIFNIEPSAAAWEPLVYYLAVVRQSATAAEDVVTLMINAGLTPTSVCVDALARASDSPEAVEKFEEMFNATGVRPAPSTLLAMLDKALASKDAYESQRICSVIRRMYSEEEREAQVVGLSTTARSIGKNNALSKRLELLERNIAKGQTAEAKKAAQDKVESGEETAVNNQRLKRQYDEKKQKQMKSSPFENYVVPLESHYRLDENRGAVGGGRSLSAPLSSQSLTRRFAEAGIEMPKF
jgi:hypothetical protein